MPEKDIKISIIIPVYRTEKYLEKCVSSVLEQTYGCLEVILVDDGSDDGSPAMCDSFAQRDSRVSVIHKENGGLSDARNAGLLRATGEYVTFIDSDDYIDSDMLSYMLERGDGADIIICGVTCIEKGKATVMPSFGEEKALTCIEALTELFRDDKIKNYVSNKLFRRQLFDGIQFPKGLAFEDIATVYKVFMKAERVTVLPESRFNYVRREGSISKTVSVKNLYHRFKAHRMRFEDIAETLPQAGEELLRQMLFSARALALGILENNDFENNGEILGELTAFYRKNLNQLQQMSNLNKYEKKQVTYLAEGTRESFRKLRSTDFLRKVNKLMKG